MLPTPTLTLGNLPSAHSRAAKFCLREYHNCITGPTKYSHSPSMSGLSLLPWLSIWCWIPVVSLSALAKNFLGSICLQFHSHVFHFHLRMSFSFSCEIKSLWVYITSTLFLSTLEFLFLHIYSLLGSFNFRGRGDVLLPCPGKPISALDPIPH